MTAKWDEAVRRLLALPDKQVVTAKYFERWHGGADKTIESLSDADADLMNRVIDEHLGMRTSTAPILDGMADEYDETMQAQEILEGMK
jgi:hypothetical protein